MRHREDRSEAKKEPGQQGRRWRHAADDRNDQALLPDLLRVSDDFDQ